MQRITTSVTAATIRRVVQSMPRLTHHNSAQLITTGTMISSCKRLAGCRSATTIASRVFRIPPFIACEMFMLRNELDADSLSAPPDHFAVSPRSGVARERQPQSGRQRVEIVHRDLGTRGG